MGKFFANNDAPQHEILASRFHSTRHNLLLIVIFSLINIVLLVTKSGTYFLFSAFIPYMFVDYGMYFCGLYPAEFYEPNTEFVNTFFLHRCLLMTCSVFAFYFQYVNLYLTLWIGIAYTGGNLLCWIFSKKPRVGWVIAALVFFVIDTIVMLLAVASLVENIIDILFHVYVIFSLSRGIYSYYKLKKIPVEPEQSMEQEIPETISDDTVIS